MLNIKTVFLSAKEFKRIQKAKKKRYRAIKLAILEANKSKHMKSSYGASILNTRTGDIFVGHNTLFSREFRSKKRDLIR